MTERSSAPETTTPADSTSDHDGWTPVYGRWRHGGWYVVNVRYPSGATGCVSCNFPDGKWRIVCDPRPFEEAPTFRTRDEAARAERALVASQLAALRDETQADEDRPQIAPPATPKPVTSASATGDPLGGVTPAAAGTLVAADGLPIAVGDVVHEYTGGRTGPEPAGLRMGTHRVVGVDPAAGVLFTDRYADAGQPQAVTFPQHVRHAEPGAECERVFPAALPAPEPTHGGCDVPPSPVPDADARLAALLATNGEELRGCMRDGYTDDDVNAILGQLADTVGLNLVCVWDYVDTWGPGGNSDFFILAPNGQLHELIGELWRWLNDDPEDPQAPTHPGTPGTWVGPPDDRPDDACAWNDGRHNFAVENRDGGGDHD